MRFQRRTNDQLELGLVVFFAMAAGVAVAILYQIPTAQLSAPSNVATIIVAGLVIAAAYVVVGWSILRKRK